MPAAIVMSMCACACERVCVRTSIPLCVCVCVWQAGPLTPAPCSIMHNSFPHYLKHRPKLILHWALAATILDPPRNQNTLWSWHRLQLSLVGFCYGLLCLCLFCVFLEWLMPLKEMHQPWPVIMALLLAAGCARPAPGTGEPGLLICCDRR